MMLVYTCLSKDLRLSDFLALIEGVDRSCYITSAYNNAVTGKQPSFGCFWAILFGLVCHGVHGFVKLRCSFGLAATITSQPDLGTFSRQLAIAKRCSMVVIVGVWVANEKPNQNIQNLFGLMPTQVLSYSHILLTNHTSSQTSHVAQQSIY